MFSEKSAASTSVIVFGAWDWETVLTCPCISFWGAWITLVSLPVLFLIVSLLHFLFTPSNFAHILSLSLHHFFCNRNIVARNLQLVAVASAGTKAFAGCIQGPDYGREKRKQIVWNIHCYRYYVVILVPFHLIMLHSSMCRSETCTHPMRTQFCFH